MKKVLCLMTVILFLVAFIPSDAFAAGTITTDSIEKAITYAYNEKSTRPDYWKGYCAAFVWSCYHNGANLSNSSFATAREMGDALITHTDANPPRGALVFWYKTSNPYGHAGHVGLSLGDGTVIHAYSSIKVTSISTVNNGGYTYRGWGSPISGCTLETEAQPAELTLTGAVYPSGHYDSLPNFGLRGIFNSPGTITEVNAKIVTQSGSVHMSYSTAWNSSTYNIQTDGLNNQFTFRDLPDGFYQYYVEAKDSYGKTASASSWFSIGTVTYTIHYDANGGSGEPSNQTKTHDTVLTLSSTKPTRENSNPGSYIVTLDANDGSGSVTSLNSLRTTSYSFKNWNTAPDGSETSYNAGVSYTENAAATLYAQWNISTTTAAVTLPTPTRTGYAFKGWGTSSTETSGVTGSYTPTRNITLYAVWEANSYTVSFNANGGEVSEHSRTVIYGSRYGALPVPTRTGYLFIGWFSEPDGGTQYTENTLVGTFADNQMLYAHWHVAINETNFPDAAFRSYISTSFDTDRNGYLSDAEVSAIEEINVSATRDNPGAITRLYGIEFFTNLEALWCNDNQLTMLDVSRNLKLKWLNCDGNDLTELDVRHNTALLWLLCDHNNLEEIDISHNTELTDLHCGGNQLKTLDISQNNKLGLLWCYDNQLDSLDVSKNVALTRLSCQGNRIRAIDISNCPSLVTLVTDSEGGNGNYYDEATGNELYCDSNVALFTEPLTGEGIIIDETIFPDEVFRAWVSANCDINRDRVLCEAEIAAVKEITVYGGNENQGQISSLSGIELFTALEKLDCSFNQLSALDVSKNTALVELNCNANHLTSLNTNQNSALQKLWCSNNQLTDLDVSANTSLKDLACVGNQLTELNVSNNTLLESLACGMSFSNYYIGNQLTSLDVSNNTNLTSLYCDNNQLLSLNVTNNPKLLQLTCSRNQLTALDLSSNNDLLWLSCWGNQLGALNVSCCSNLHELSASNNILTELNITGCTELHKLYCSWNQLQAVDVSTCPELQSFECGANPLGSLDISNNPALTHLGCFENQLTELDLSNNPALQEMWCYSNQLAQLDLTGCPNLYFLSCWDNRLPALNIRSNATLQRLFCYQNLLSSLDISACPNLIQLTTTALPTTENGVNQYADQENGYYLWVDEGIALVTSVNSLNPDLTLPAALTTIESEAFSGGAFSYVRLPENAISIGWHAFADCPNLGYIYIPALTTKIDEQAFGTIQSLTILGKSGSTAEDFAIAHGFTFIPVS